MQGYRITLEWIAPLSPGGQAPPAVSTLQLAQWQTNGTDASGSGAAPPSMHRTLLSRFNAATLNTSGPLRLAEQNAQVRARVRGC